MFEVMGNGSHQILGLSSSDPILSLVGPIGLAAAAGTALIIDLIGETRGAERTLDDMAADGPTLSELSPGRKGIAMISGGNIARADAIEAIARLNPGWPAVVVRVRNGAWPFPIVPVEPLFPGRLAPVPDVHHGVWQPIGVGAEPPGPGPVLPRLRAGALRRLLAGQLPRRSRWIEAWRPVWEMPWA